ncbi:MAG: 2-oxoglutarate dehydrogenase complex dihydrolipoyllysine-residue succinyltransferase [Isosphaeraceae bacterium]
MAAVPITVPGVGESITEGILARWLKPDGSLVKAGEPLFELETDKANNVVPAGSTGVLKIAVAEGQTVAIGATIGTLDPAATPAEVAAPAQAQAASSAPASVSAPSASRPAAAAAAPNDGTAAAADAGVPLAPAVRRLVAENQIDPANIAPTGRGGRITKGDVLAYLQAPAPAGEKGETVAPSPATAPAGDASPPGGTAFQATGGDRSQDSRATTAGRETRQRMSGLRQRVAQRLVQAQQTAAILTTFNEADMSRVQDLRARYKELFRTRHGVGLGFMSFFVKAVVEALRNYPTVNGRIDGNDIVYHNFHDIGVAVSTDRGLMVPVLRNADAMSFAEIEKAIAAYAEKGRKGTITVDDLQGGTFTITNGGTFGSLLSTPILNPPQSGILGMHAIKKRPVVVDDQIVVRPMMYLAFSYDHRIIDGREAVSFLVRIKECIEDPERLMLAL